MPSSSSSSESDELSVPSSVLLALPVGLLLAGRFPYFSSTVLVLA